MNETGLNRTKPWTWEYTIIAKETDNNQIIIPFTNITKGTKREVENIIFPKIRRIVRKDIDAQLRKHIQETDLVLTINDESIKDYSQDQVITTTIKVNSREHPELSDEIYLYDLIIKGQPHDISNNNDIKIGMEDKTYNFGFINITKGTKVEVQTHLGQVFKETISKVFEFEITAEDFILTTNISEITDFTKKQNIQITIATMGTKISGNITISVIIIGLPHNINDIELIKTLQDKNNQVDHAIKFTNITKGTKAEVTKDLIIYFEDIIKNQLKFEVTQVNEEDYKPIISAAEIIDYSSSQQIILNITTIGSRKISGDVVLYINIIGIAHDINDIEIIKQWENKEQEIIHQIDFINITKGTKAEVQTHLVSYFKNIIEESLQFQVKLDEDFVITSDVLDINDYCIPQKNNISLLLKGEKLLVMVFCH